MIFTKFLGMNVTGDHVFKPFASKLLICVYIKFK